MASKFRLEKEEGTNMIKNGLIIGELLVVCISINLLWLLVNRSTECFKQLIKEKY